MLLIRKEFITETKKKTRSAATGTDSFTIRVLFVFIFSASTVLVIPHNLAQIQCFVKREEKKKRDFLSGYAVERAVQSSRSSTPAHFLRHGSEPRQQKNTDSFVSTGSQNCNKKLTVQKKQWSSKKYQPGWTAKFHHYPKGGQQADFLLFRLKINYHQPPKMQVGKLKILPDFLFLRRRMLPKLHRSRIGLVTPKWWMRAGIRCFRSQGPNRPMPSCIPRIPDRHRNSAFCSGFCGKNPRQSHTQPVFHRDHAGKIALL